MDLIFVLFTISIISSKISISSQHCTSIKHTEDSVVNCFYLDSVTIGQELKEYGNKIRYLNIQFSNFNGTPSWVGDFNIKNLTIHHSGIDLQKKNTFSNFYNLISLDLSNNYIRELGDGILEQLTSLITLDLSFNNLPDRSLPNGSFALLASLRELDLSHNLLKELRKEWNIPKSLKQFIISYNSIAFIPVNFFLDLTNLEVIDLSHNNITELGDNLQFPTGLIELYLNDNLIEYIADDTLKDLTTVQIIDLSHNNILKFEIEFQLPESLLTLDLSHNFIQELSNRIFNEKSPLKDLNLSHNNMTYLRKTQFARLSNLNSLNIGYNFLEHIDDDIFSNTEKLSTLNVSGNSLYDLPMMPKSLAILDSSHNQITELNEDIIASCFHVIYLDISYNSLSFKKEIPMEKMNNLRHLVLNYLDLDEQSIIFNFLNDKISTIYLQGNLITRLNLSLLSKIPHLTLLDVRNNQIRSIDDSAFLKMSKLEVLYLQGNRLKTISPYLFLNTTSLRVLNLSGNEIKHIPIGAFEKLKKLAVLNLSFNRLKILEVYTLYPLKDLQKLYLNDNQLSEIQDDVSDNSHLYEISIENNNWSCEDLYRLITILDKKSTRIISRGNKKSENRIEGIECSDASPSSSNMDISLLIHFTLGLQAVMIVIFLILMFMKVRKRQLKNRILVGKYMLPEESQASRSTEMTETDIVSPNFYVEHDKAKRNSNINIEEKNFLYHCYEEVKS